VSVERNAVKVEIFRGPMLVLTLETLVRKAGLHLTALIFVCTWQKVGYYSTK